MPPHHTGTSRAAHTSCTRTASRRSEEHTSELQSQSNLVCRLLLEKKKKCQFSDSITSVPLSQPSPPSARHLGLSSGLARGRIPAPPLTRISRPLSLIPVANRFLTR